MNAKSYVSKGIRILDRKNNVVSVDLDDILDEINNPQNLFWSILDMQVHRYYGPEPRIADLEEEARKLPNGLQIPWKRLVSLSKHATQFEDLILIGCKNKEKLIREETAVSQYESVDFYIEMFDCSYWEIFSKDHEFINSLEGKFKETETLSPDFREKSKG